MVGMNLFYLPNNIFCGTADCAFHSRSIYFISYDECDLRLGFSEAVPNFILLAGTIVKSNSGNVLFK